MTHEDVDDIIGIDNQIISRKLTHQLQINKKTTVKKSTHRTAIDR
jgi:hypothetical protein